MYTHTHTHIKFKLHGHSSPDPKRSRVPSLVRSGSAARITFQLHAHTYTSSVKLHYNTTKTQTTTTIIFVSQYILQLLGCSGGGGGQPQISKSVVLHTKDYGISMGVLSSFFHSSPTSSTQLFVFGARLLRPQGCPELGGVGATSSSSSLEPAASSSVLSLEDSWH